MAMRIRRTLNMFRNISNWNTYVGTKLFGNKKEEILFKARNGISVLVPKRLLPEFKESFFEEIYTKGFPKEKLPSGKIIVLDVGANVGFFSAFALSKFPDSTVHAFEPIKINFEQLLKTKQLNANKNFFTHQKAVSDKNGSVVLRFNENDFTTSASLLENKTGTHEEKVETISIEEFMKQQNISIVDLLKLDCEGAEYSIIYSMSDETFSQIKLITIETHPGSSEKENHVSLVNFLKQKNFIVNDVQGNLGFIWAWK